MRNLIQRQLRGELSPAQLEELRQYLEQSSDEDLAEHLEALWMSYEGESELNPDGLERLHRAINAEQEERATAEQLQPTNAARPVRRYLLWAAAALVPLLLLLNVYQWWRGANYETGAIAMTTEYRQRSSITLPDGSKVLLNEHSQLSYRPEDFGLDKRSVRFEGEAYFDVASDAKRPFVLQQGELSIRVLGTRFHLRALDNEPYVRIDLDEGRVALGVSGQKEEVYLRPQEYAVYDKTNHSIEVHESQQAGSDKAWMQGELVFTDVPLSSVLSAIEKRYGVSLEYDAQRGRILFTGTLPEDNLPEALEIVRRAMGIEIKIKQ